ncbi:MAG TPA: hypothetical protein VGC85_08580 [Chthoniobacterales bacterium]
MNNVHAGLNRSGQSWVRSTVVAIIGLALGIALWTATVPMTMAQGGGSAIRQIEANLPHGQTVANASKADLLAAICAAVKKNPPAAPQIARTAASARPDMARDILRTVFRCLGNDNCDLLGRVLRALTSALPDQASGLTSLAIEVSPDCAGSFPGAGGGNENYGPGAVNQNPPPGTIAGGGGQGNVVAVCHNGHTIFLSPQGAENDLRNNPGDTLGPCVVTPVTNK